MMEQNLPARLIPIDQIRPDPTQPRRLLPRDLGEALAAGATPSEILTQLRSRVGRDKWTRERLVKLDALANSIAADGLMQPIRIFPSGDDRYEIEEGERRWWAHHILVQQGKDQFRNIATFVVDRDSESSGLLRRRVAENVLRSDFTAIELARATVGRIQEILVAEPDTKQGDAERRVGSENGMSDRRVRQFAALLTLSPEVQELAQQARLSENSLRRIVGIKDTARQLAAVRELMRPPLKKATSHDSSRAVNRPRPEPSLNRRPRDQAKRVRVSDKSSSRCKRTVRRPIVGKTRHDNEKGASRTIQRVLLLARSFNAKDWSALKTTSWAQVAKKETDRRALSKLRDVLERGLKTADRANVAGAATDNDRGHLGE